MRNDSNGGSFWITLGVIYLVISQIMALYFWWEWAHEHGFWSSLIIGPFVAEFKGFLWFFFI
jgi:hypothetical protein